MYKKHANIVYFIHHGLFIQRAQCILYIYDPFIQSAFKQKKGIRKVCLCSSIHSFVIFSVFFCFAFLLYSFKNEQQQHNNKIILFSTRTKLKQKYSSIHTHANSQTRTQTHPNILFAIKTKAIYRRFEAIRLAACLCLYVYVRTIYV